ncbi:MAG: GPW/gp25 family protein [Thermosynechococcaceae cyanobacterium]
MASNPILKQDIKLTRRVFDQMVSDRQSVDVLTSLGGDLATLSDRENLAQAILNRLLTRKGELAKLGHPDYGSRLHTLVGELNNQRTQGFAALYIQECLAQEPRIQKITQLAFAPPSRGIDRDVLDVAIAVLPVGLTESVGVNFTLNLGG